MSRGGVELLFRVFADRYERGSMLVTTQPAVQRVGPDLPGGADDRGVARPPDHHCHIFEMNGESYRFRESMKTKKGRKAE